MVYMRVTSVGNFKSDVYRSADSGKTWVKHTTPEFFKDYAGEGIIRIFSAQANKKEVGDGRWRRRLFQTNKSARIG